MFGKASGSRVVSRMIWVGVSVKQARLHLPVKIRHVVKDVFRFMIYEFVEKWQVTSGAFAFFRKSPLSFGSPCRFAPGLHRSKMISGTTNTQTSIARSSF